ncbi:GumC family protein [Phenylobacterium sp.]|uniref:GumC family protein n=1 Tax=Phenylobacterium sp. TaxID=1871053 RepID=UPI0035B313B4
MNASAPVPYRGAPIAPFAAARRPEPQTSKALDPRQWIAAALRHLKLFLGVVVLVVAVAVIVTLLQEPKYVATANVLLDPREERVSNEKAVLSDLPTDSSAASYVVDTEVEILRSPRLARRVVDVLGLERDPEFNRRLKKDGTYDASRRFTEAERIATAAAVSKRLGVRRAALTYVIDVTFTSKDPQKAARIANAFADLYIVGQLEAKFGANEQATKWLQGRMTQLQAQVLSDEAAVQQYKIQNNLLSASGASLTEQEISTHQESLAAARVQVAEDAARLQTARAQLARGSRGDDVGEALASPVVQDLRKQRAEVSRKVAELEVSFRDGYPELDKAKSQLRDIDAEIQAEIQRTITNLQARLNVSQQRAAAIASNLGGAKGQLTSNTRAMVRLNELERNAEASRVLYASYLNRFKETSSQRGLAQADARIASEAVPPLKPASPNKKLNLALGLIAGVGLGGLAVAMAEYMRVGLRTSDDVEQMLGHPYLGAIPELSSVVARARGSVRNQLRGRPMDYVVARPLSAFPEAFRNLKASALALPQGEPVRTVAVTSALPREGKSTVSICLARTAALQGWRVLLIDCDLRRPGLTAAMGLEPRSGLLQVLRGEAQLEDAIVHDEASGADLLLLPGKTDAINDVFGSEAMDALLARLKQRYDLVVLDTAPVLPVADSRILAAKADTVIFAANWNKTPRRAVQTALKILESMGARIAGVTLTRVNMEQQVRYGYGDADYYFRDYRGYYAET